MARNVFRGAGLSVRRRPVGQLEWNRGNGNLGARYGRKRPCDDCSDHGILPSRQGLLGWADHDIDVFHLHDHLYLRPHVDHVDGAIVLDDINYTHGGSIDDFDFDIVDSARLDIDIFHLHLNDLDIVNNYDHASREATSLFLDVDDIKPLTDGYALRVGV